MRRYTLRDPDIEVRPVNHLEMEWSGAANRGLARQIGFQAQFAEFFRHLLDNLQSTPVENPGWRPTQLSLSLRAGAIRTYALITVSILEGALAALGEERGLGRRGGELYARTFGQLLDAWKDGDQPRNEIAPIWEDLQTLKAVRNYVHLSRAATADEAHWQEILENEADIMRAADSAVAHLRDMCHVFRD